MKLRRVVEGPIVVVADAPGRFQLGQQQHRPGVALEVGDDGRVGGAEIGGVPVVQAGNDETVAIEGDSPGVVDVLARLPAGPANRPRR
jgi:hypothetical protein